jgi:6-phosphogluconolactonase
MRHAFVLLASTVACAAAAAVLMSAAEPTLVLVGTYTGSKSKSEGIYAFKLDPVTGALTPQGLAARTDNPSFLAEHPNGKWVYAVNETDSFQGKKTGGVSAFALDRNTGKLTAIDQQSSEGTAPCHIAVDGSGRYVFVANYSSGSVAVLPISENGGVGEAVTTKQHEGSSVNPERQKGPHAHAVVPSSDNEFLLTADLGLDKIIVYRFSQLSGALNPAAPAKVLTPGAGPRHLVFDAQGAPRVYVINEMGNTISLLSWNPTSGALSAPEQTISTLPQGFSGESTTAEIVAHPSGKFLYGSNRGHDSIAVFSIDRATGKLTSKGFVPTRGKEPRSFNIDPTGRWLIAANQNSDTLSVFEIDQQTGALTPKGGLVEAPTPVCVLFVK